MPGRASHRGLIGALSCVGHASHGSLSGATHRKPSLVGSQPHGVPSSQSDARTRPSSHQTARAPKQRPRTASAPQSVEFEPSAPPPLLSQEKMSSTRS
jgi:hypothetical protein